MSALADSNDDISIQLRCVMISGKAPTLATAFWRHLRKIRSRRETSLQLTAKFCRERFDSTSCAFLSNNHFSPGYVDYPQETI
jgi:predicted DNA-binding ribbon-helix-helix protein